MKSNRDGHVCPALAQKHLQRGLRSGRYRLTELGLERCCSKCREYYPADTEFFYYQPSANAGLSNYCHACYREVTGRLSKADQDILKEAS